ncbi:MAG TPA: hypothetical protein VFF06_25765 [Polyangia bacterium]|nr:hypothetical protein [Polyangia bacterium]
MVRSAALVAVWLAACNSVSPSTGIDLANGGDLGLDAALPGDDADPLVGAMPQNARFVGNAGVNVFRSYSNAGASFFWPGFATTCSTQRTGSCIETMCTNSVDGGQSSAASAGTITIVSAAPIVALTYASGKYSSFVGMPSPWHGGDSLTISAAGDTVPSFSTTLLAPGPIVLRSPVVQHSVNTDTVTATRGEDLALSWTSGIAGYIVFSYGSSTALAPNAPSFSCSFPARDGTGVIPAAVVDNMSRVSGSYVGDFALESERHLLVGDALVDVVVNAEIDDSQGVELGLVTLQFQ